MPQRLTLCRLTCLLSCCFFYFAVLLQARDGVTLPSYLTLPPLPSTPKTLLPQSPEPSGPGAQGWGSVSGLQLPLVLFVHGGPWARDGWGLDSTAQWFANRGYAVLQVRLIIWLLHFSTLFGCLRVRRRLQGILHVTLIQSLLLCTLHLLDTKTHNTLQNSGLPSRRSLSNHTGVTTSLLTHSCCAGQLPGQQWVW